MMHDVMMVHKKETQTNSIGVLPGAVTLVMCGVTTTRWGRSNNNAPLLLLSYSPFVTPRNWYHEGSSDPAGIRTISI
jgi:hypothetical protein